ncbi:MAG TPA: DUF6263 family protein [Chryseolinea sp.]|nr:DUF6263 family protein [Chryseolinea sp.]
MKTIGVFILLFASLGFTHYPNSIRLEYVFKVGDEYVMAQNTKQVLKQMIMGTEQKGENEYSGETKLKVAQVTDDGAKIEMQFMKLKSRSVTIMGEMVMDSEGSDEQVQNKMLKTMMKKPFFVTMNKSGKVSNVEGAEKLWSELGTLNMDDQTTAKAKQILEQFMDNSALKSNIEQAMVHYSNDKVKEGDKWNSMNEFPMEFPIKADNSWSLISLTSGTAKVNADGVFTTTDKEKTIDLPNSIKAKVDLSGGQQLKSTVDVKTGWATDIQIHSELKGKMILLAGGMLPENMDVPMEIVTDTSYKITKK